MMDHRRTGRNRAQSHGTPATAARRVEGTKTAGSLAAAGFLERLRQIGRQGRLEIQLDLRDRVDEPKPLRMQELPLETEVALHTVGRIAGDGKIDLGEMDADLMRPPRLEADVEQRMLGHQFNQLEPGHGGARLFGVERSTRRIAAISPDGSVDPPCSRPRLSAY